MLLPGYYFLWQHLSRGGEQFCKATDNWLLQILWNRKSKCEHSAQTDTSTKKDNQSSICVTWMNSSVIHSFQDRFNILNSWNCLGYVTNSAESVTPVNINCSFLLIMIDALQYSLFQYDAPFSFATKWEQHFAGEEGILWHGCCLVLHVHCNTTVWVHTATICYNCVTTSVMQFPLSDGGTHRPQICRVQS